MLYKLFSLWQRSSLFGKKNNQPLQLWITDDKITNTNTTDDEITNKPQCVQIQQFKVMVQSAKSYFMRPNGWFQTCFSQIALSLCLRLRGVFQKNVSDQVQKSVIE